MLFNLIIKAFHHVATFVFAEVIRRNQEIVAPVESDSERSTKDYLRGEKSYRNGGHLSNY